tara:strand:- start:41 stop:352 length:312 start_codon:yes stop_codon:yes gene_type:complete
MKVSKRQLRKIIKEEKSRLLNEMNPRANAERALGMYASTALLDTFKKNGLDLMQGIELEAYEDLDDELSAEEAAVGAFLMVISQVLGEAGYVNQAREVKGLVK